MRIWCLSLIFHKKTKENKISCVLKHIPSDWLDKPGFLNFNIYDRIIENLNLVGKISKSQNVLTLFCWIHVLLRKPKFSGVTVLRITNLIMKTGKKFTSIILNVQSSLVFDPFISRFFIGLLLFVV